MIAHKYNIKKYIVLTSLLFFLFFATTQHKRYVGWVTSFISLFKSKKPRKWTSLHAAVVANDYQEVKSLLKNKKIDPNIQNDDGWTSLYVAILGGVQISK